MAEQYSQDYTSFDSQSLLRNLEEKQHLLKDRILIIGKSFVDEREKNFFESQNLKKEIILIKEEHKRMKELLQRVSEQLSNTARREELLILQRQLDLLRSVKDGAN